MLMGAKVQFDCAYFALNIRSTIAHAISPLTHILWGKVAFAVQKQSRSFE